MENPHHDPLVRRDLHDVLQVAIQLLRENGIELPLEQVEDHVPETNASFTSMEAKRLLCSIMSEGHWATLVERSNTAIPSPAGRNAPEDITTSDF
jgi:hypothetical protein